MVVLVRFGETAWRLQRCRPHKHCSQTQSYGWWCLKFWSMILTELFRNYSLSKSSFPAWLGSMITELLLFLVLEALESLSFGFSMDWARTNDSFKHAESSRTERLPVLGLYLVCIKGLPWVQELAEADRGLDFCMVPLVEIILLN